MRNILALGAAAVIAGLPIVAAIYGTGASNATRSVLPADVEPTAASSTAAAENAAATTASPPPRQLPVPGADGDEDDHGDGGDDDQDEDEDGD